MEFSEVRLEVRVDQQGAPVRFVLQEVVGFQGVEEAGDLSCIRFDRLELPFCQQDFSLVAVFGVGAFSLLNAIDVVADPPKFASEVEASVGLCHFEASSLPGGVDVGIPRHVDQYVEVRHITITTIKKYTYIHLRNAQGWWGIYSTDTSGSPVPK